MFEINISCPKCNTNNEFEETLDLSTELLCKNCKSELCNIKPVAGYVYVLSNSSMPGLLKIGFTNRKVEERVEELNSATGVPEPFVIEIIYNSDEPEREEKLIHSSFNGNRKSSAREFFELKVEKALESMTKVLNRDPKFVRTLNIKRSDSRYIFENDPGTAAAPYSFVCNDCGKRFYCKGPKGASYLISCSISCPFCGSKNYD